MFIRRFSAIPSLAVILAVSGVVVVDAPPPRPVQAAPFGKILVVAEFEDGPFNTPTDLLQASDQADRFGLLGYQYGGKKYQYPCALRSGGSELWNGNGWIQTARLVFGGGLAFCRVDTSTGTVTLTPRAFVQGTAKAPYLLANGQTLTVVPNGGSAVTVTFAGTAASTTATAGGYTSFTGGETLRLSLDDGALFDVVFQPGDNTLQKIIDRINGVYGQTIASNASSQLKITSLRLGTGSKVVVVASAVATTLGLTAGTQSGTGDAADLSATTYAEVKAKIEGASALLAGGLSSDGYLRVASKLGGTGTVQITGGTALPALGLTAGAAATTAALPVAVSIPAGTRVTAGSDAGGRRQHRRHQPEGPPGRRRWHVRGLGVGLDDDARGPSG